MSAGAITGRVHSVESCGTLDGPGIRFVTFLQGCHFKCIYCHNPDARAFEGGIKYTPQALWEEADQYKNFFQFSGGGVTVSGGEPLLQAKFVKEYFRLCKESGLHTALDTTGSVLSPDAMGVLNYTDLVLLDIKCMDHEGHLEITGARLQPVLNFLDLLKQKNIRTWIRHVVLPGKTDDPEMLHKLGQLLKDYPNVDKVDLLPLHKMGEYKWQALGMEYPVKDMPEPTVEDLENCAEILREYGITACYSV